MRVNGLGSSLFFGVAASVAAVFVQHVFAPLVGSWNVLAIYLTACLVVYSAMIGESARASIRNAVIASTGAIAVLGLAGTTGAGLAEVAIGFTGVLALVRSGFGSGAFGSRLRPRAVVLECVLGGTALLFAAWLASPGWLGSAAGLWGFVLVQSLYFLMPSRSGAVGDGEGGDRFDRARDRLLAMLEEV